MTEVSVVIPAYRCPHLPDLLRALLAGTRKADQIIVSHSGPDDPTAEIARISGAIRVLHDPGRLPAGAARNRGAEIATGAWLAFIDADVQPRPDWLAELAAAMRDGRFVVGSVGYATSGGYWGLCNWLSEFGAQTPWQPARAQSGGASCNMITTAADFRAAGGFPGDYQPGEDTMLFTRLRQNGIEMWFEPAAQVDHHNNWGSRRFSDTSTASATIAR